MEHTKNNVVIWSWYPNDELDVAELIGFDLYGGAVIKRRYYDRNRFRENDFNVIVINHFFHDHGKPRGKEDLSFADLIILVSLLRLLLSNALEVVLYWSGVKSYC